MENKFKENAVIIEDTLSSIIYRAQKTQEFYDNKKAIDKLNNASGEALKTENNINDIYILEQLYSQMLGLQKVSTSNGLGLFSKKQTSREFIRSVISQLKEKNNSLIDNINKELSNLPLMKKEYYDVISNNTTNNSRDILNKEYHGMIPRTINLEDYDKVARSIVQRTAIKMKTTKIDSYMVVDGYYINENGEKENQYKNLGIVNAGLYNYEKEVKINIDKEILNLLKPEHVNGKKEKTFTDINAQFEKILNSEITKYQTNLSEFKGRYPMEDVVSLENVVNKITSLLEEANLYRKSIIMYKRFGDFIENNLSSGQKYQIVDKIKKEVREFEKNLSKLRDEIKELENVFEVNKEKIKNNSEIVIENKKSENVNKKVVTDKSSNTKNEINNNKDLKVNYKDSASQINELEEIKEKLVGFQKKKQTLPNEDNTIVSDLNSSSQEQKDMYDKYKEIREKLDSLFERKAQFSNGDYFRQEVVNSLWLYGETYEKIIENIRDMREQLDVTQIISKIIDEVRSEYDNIDEMKKEDENGLTNFENRIIGRLISTQVGNEISDELRSEINYYVERYQRLESEVKFVFMNKNYYDKEIYQEVLDNLKLKYYLNTNILDEVCLSNKIESSRSI